MTRVSYEFLYARERPFQVYFPIGSWRHRIDSPFPAEDLKLLNNPAMRLLTLLHAPTGVEVPLRTDITGHRMDKIESGLGVLIQLALVDLKEELQRRDLL